MIKTATFLRRWQRELDDADIRWTDIVGVVGDLGTMARTLSGWMFLDSIDIRDIDKNGVRVEIYTSTQGGDTEDILIPWTVLEAENPFAAAKEERRSRRKQEKKKRKAFLKEKAAQAEEVEYQQYLRLKEKYREG